MPRVLLVEDSATQAAVIRIQLKVAGFEAELAADGMQALAAIEAAAPDMVLTDLQMPELNGVELTAELRRLHPGLPVVITTTGGNEELALAALKSGAVDYVPKAVLPQDLKPTLHQVWQIATTEHDPARLARIPSSAAGSYELAGDASLVPVLAAYLKYELSRRVLWDATGILQIAVALSRVLNDATCNPPQPVNFTAAVSLAKAVLIVRQEGLRLPAPHSPDLDTTLGRTELLMQCFFDEVQHDAAGRGLTLVKRCAFE